jgi:hypothetical protein
MKMEKRIGDLVGIDGSKRYNHGCQNYAVCKVFSLTDGTVTVRVVEANSCHSFWQVGHTADYVFYNVGDIVNIPASEIVEASDVWTTDIKWEWE